jgi:penicillin-binding protein 1B
LRAFTGDDDVASRGRAHRRRGGRRAPAGRRVLRALALVLLGAGFAGGFVAARYGLALDKVVRSRFEGRLFLVPSRVHSAPTILYPGLDWKQVGLREVLARLGYRELDREGELPPGAFRWQRDRVRLHRRAFEHPTRAEPARDVVFRVRGGEIDEILELPKGRSLGAVLIEPELVGAYYGPEHEQRDLVRLGDVPGHLIDAVLAVEDQRFLQHPGIDVRRILGALWVNLRSGGIRQGGSTLTQQLVKNFFLTPERSLRRKAQEAAMALIVEARYDKEAILECYLNEIYLGQRGSTAIHGVGEAAHLYFGKSVRDLTIAESALLAAIIRSPNGLSPHRESAAATERRDLVLRLMLEQGRVDDASYAAAVAEPLRVARVTPEPREARYFLDALRRQLPDFYDAEMLVSQGLEIYSTLDIRLQLAAARAVREELAALEERHPRLRAEGPARLQACVVALRPQTGEVLALVGGRSYAESQFDRCSQARRQAGSAFKPFVLAAALERDGHGPVITLASTLDDTPFQVDTPSGPWRPVNFDREFHGAVPVREAMERSLNVPLARLAQRVGIERVAEAARRMGIESPLPAVPSLALGAADVTPLELARAYATLANGGIRPQIRTFEDVVDPAGHTVERQPIGFERVIDAGTAFLVTSVLEGVVERGTARAVRAAGIVGPLAGKTGTTDDERDAWFVGFSPELVAAVWIGFDEPRSLGLPSTQIALPLWIRFVREATGGRVRGAFLPPGDVEELEVHPRTGALALAGCPERRAEYFLLGTEPAQVCPAWAVRDDGRWPPRGEAGRPGERGEPRRRPPERGLPGLIERLFDAWLGRP